MCAADYVNHSQGTVRDKSPTSAGGPGDSASPASPTRAYPAGSDPSTAPHLREIMLPKAVCFPRFFPKMKWEGRLQIWGEMETFIKPQLLTQHRSLVRKEDREATGNYLLSLMPPLKGSA